jgi:hypothetical protein
MVAPPVQDFDGAFHSTVVSGPARRRRRSPARCRCRRSSGRRGGRRRASQWATANFSPGSIHDAKSIDTDVRSVVLARFPTRRTEFSVKPGGPACDGFGRLSVRYVPGLRLRRALRGAVGPKRSCLLTPFRTLRPRPPGATATIRSEGHPPPPLRPGGVLYPRRRGAGRCRRPAPRVGPRVSGIAGESADSPCNRRVSAPSGRRQKQAPCIGRRAGAFGR